MFNVRTKEVIHYSNNHSGLSSYQFFARKVIPRYGHVKISVIQNEFRAVTKLCQSSHPNIVQVFDMGQLKRDSASYFIDMEICSNVTLAQYISGAEVPTLDRWDPKPANICQVLEHTVNGLAFIHGLGEVHRDLSPQNSMFPLFSPDVD